MKCVTRSRASAEKAEAETSAELKGLKKSAPSSCVPSFISHQLHSDPKGPHNKENCKETPCSVDVLSEDQVLQSSSSLAEDSGYLSLHNSQLEHYDGETPWTETLQSCTEEEQCRPSPGHSDATSSHIHPVLKFQEEVCKQLAEAYKKTQSYDWTVIPKIAKRHSLQNIIGPKMGLEYVDILCDLLKKDMKHILTRILGLLGEYDLINCKKVSKTWWKIIHQDKSAVERCRKAEQMLRDSGRSTESLSRDFGLSRVVFSCLQSVASSTPGHKATKKTHSQTAATQNAAKPSRFAEFYEAAKSLKVHEALRRCRLCGSPSRFDSAMKRAVCMRDSCAFDFCSLCQSVYHGSSPCQGGVMKASSSRCQTVLLAGSARSKRNIRRL